MPVPSRFRQPLSSSPPPPSIAEVLLSSSGFDNLAVVVEDNAIQTAQQWQVVLDHFHVSPIAAGKLTAPMSDAARHELMALVVDGRSGFAVARFVQGCTYTFDRCAAMEVMGVVVGGGDIGGNEVPPHRVAFAYDARMLLHQATDSRIPEAPVRVQRAYEALQRHPRVAPHLDAFRVAARAATAEEILLVHHNDAYRAFLNEGIALDKHAPLKSDVYVCEDTRLAVQIACGCGIDLTRWVWGRGSSLEGDVGAASAGAIAPTFGFGLIRPPGHHCDATTPSGFCIANNVVVAVRNLQRFVVTGERRAPPRISILDLDVHHGEGTQALVEGDPTIQLISMHRYDAGRFYPFGTAGAASHIGPHGNVVNIPFDTAATDPSECFAVMSDFSMQRSWERVIHPALAAFQPELVLVSLGFDAAYGDPLGRMAVEHGFAATMCNLAAFVQASSATCRGVVCLLEGGYHPAVVAERCCECMESLLWHHRIDVGDRFAPVIPKTWRDVRAKQSQRAKEASAVELEMHVGGGSRPSSTEAPEDQLDEDVLLAKHVQWTEDTLDQVLRERQHAAVGPMGC